MPQNLTMEGPSGIIETLIDTAESYSTTTYRLTKLYVQDMIQSILTKLITQLILWCMIFFSVSLLNIGVALWIGDLLGKSYYGFFILMGLYMVLGVIFQFWLKEKVKHTFGTMIEKLSLKKAN